MAQDRLFSTPEQLQAIATGLRTYLRLPFARDMIPGPVMEDLLAHVRGGKVMGTYDFIDGSTVAGNWAGR